MTTTVDLRHLDAPKPAHEFKQPDPMDVQNARKYIARLRLERFAESFKRAKEESACD